MCTQIKQQYHGHLFKHLKPSIPDKRPLCGNFCPLTSKKEGYAGWTVVATKGETLTRETSVHTPETSRQHWFLLTTTHPTVFEIRVVILNDNMTI